MGDIISIPVLEGRIISDLEEKPGVSETRILSANNNYTPWQKLMMTITSVWGFIGTALFFSRNQHSTKND